MTIRAEAKELQDALYALGKLLTDDEPNTKQLSKMLGVVMSIVREGADLMGLSKEDITKAVGIAFAGAGAVLLAESVTFSDEE